ncbi:MAG: hypothetical protein WC787_05310 [Patescibacteria group bacterium]
MRPLILIQRRIFFLVLTLIACLSLDCSGPAGTPCDVDDDCCVDGPAFLCQLGECTFNPFVANNSAVLNARIQICNGEDPTTSSTGNSMPPPSQCVGDPEILGTQELAETTIDRDACEFPQQDEIAICQQQDQQGVNQIPYSDIFQPAIETLRNRAGISSSVPIYAVVDLQSIVSIGGGVTGHGLVLVDGKFLEILFEVASYIAMFNAGETADDYITAYDSIVSYHNSYPGQTMLLGMYYTESQAVMAETNELFYMLAGAILYHEYAHYWSWVCIDQLRAQLNGGGILNYWPSKFEDDADIIAGVLTGKAGHPVVYAMLTMDLMAFYYLQRQGYAQSFARIESDYNQYMQSSPNYSSLATRKNLIQRGWDDWAQYGNP